MFCNQCEQTAHGVGCSTSPGVCGKDDDAQSLMETLLYGLKGMCAYAHHARRLGKSDESVSAFVEEALFATVTNVNFDIPSLLELVLECGRKNLRVMELLEEAHIERFGKPEVVTVKQGAKPGPGILVTGHDMLDLSDLLDQTAGMGINVYTHGEMLPAHMYPGLNKHPHLVGHFGTAWQNQRREFDQFEGPTVVTTNCVQHPRETYADRLFTTQVTAVPGGTCIKGNDFGPVIEKAKAMGSVTERDQGESTIGFHRTVLMDKAGEIIDAVKAGAISHFFLIGGCDGAKVGRNYFTDFAKATPADSVILTLGCGKYRIRDEEYGTLANGMPRLLDMGQCNDAYGAIQIAAALANAFECGVNDLPLTLVLSWFEQKAVAVLLSLLALGVKGIRVGPAAPAFISPNVFKILQDKFDLQLIGSQPAADVAAIMAA